MFEMKNMPALPGEAMGRAATRVSAEDRKNIGVQGGAFSFHVGDKITFSSELEDESGKLALVWQYTRKPQQGEDTTSIPKAYYAAVMRNGKPSWLSIGSLTRRDGTGKYTCPLTEELGKYASFDDMYEQALKGKSITCKQMISKPFTVFVNNAPKRKADDSGYETIDRPTPELVWA